MPAKTPYTVLLRQAEHLVAEGEDRHAIPVFVYASDTVDAEACAKSAMVLFDGLPRGAAVPEDDYETLGIRMGHIRVIPADQAYRSTLPAAAKDLLAQLRVTEPTEGVLKAMGALARAVEFRVESPLYGPRESATMIAALMHWKREGLMSDRHEVDIASPTGSQPALNASQVDRLIDWVAATATNAQGADMPQMSDIRGALDALLHNVEQMRGMFDDADGKIAEALEEGYDVLAQLQNLANSYRRPPARHQADSMLALG